jgi:hypothetical protein
VAIPAGDRRFLTRQAIGYAETGTLGRSYEHDREHVRIQFSPGILAVRLAADRHP